MNDEQRQDGALMAVMAAIVIVLCLIASGLILDSLQKILDHERKSMREVLPKLETAYRPTADLLPNTEFRGKEYWPTLATVLVRGRDGRGGTVSGTGVVIGKQGPTAIVLTNEHVVHDRGYRFSCITCEGRSYGAKIEAVDDANDLALLRIRAGADYRGVCPIAKERPLAGTICWACGHTSGAREATIHAGQVVGYSRRSRTQNGRRHYGRKWGAMSLRVGEGVRPGDSGGPVVDQQGELIGIITGSRYDIDQAHDATAISLYAILPFLRQEGIVQSPNPLSKGALIGSPIGDHYLFCSSASDPSPTECFPWGCEPRERGRPDDRHWVSPENDVPPPLESQPWNQDPGQQGTPPPDWQPIEPNEPAEPNLPAPHEGESGGGLRDKVRELGGKVGEIAGRVDQIADSPWRSGIAGVLSGGLGSGVVAIVLGIAVRRLYKRVPILERAVERISEWRDDDDEDEEPIRAPALPMRPRRKRRRRETTGSGTQPPQTRTVNQIVRVPVETEGEAYREAARKLGNEYPGSASTLEKLEEYKRQILHGRHVETGAAQKSEHA